MIFSPFVLVTWKFWVWPELDRSFSFNKLKWIILLIFLNQLLFLYILNSFESTSLPLLRYAMLYKLNCIFELFYYCDLLLQCVRRKPNWCEWYFFYKSVVSWQPQFPYWPILYYSVKINFFFNFCEILRFLTSFQYHYYNDFKIETSSSWDGYHLLQSV